MSTVDVAAGLQLLACAAVGEKFGINTDSKATMISFTIRGLPSALRKIILNLSTKSDIPADTHFNYGLAFSLAALQFLVRKSSDS
jgi:hypothetical protein